MIAVQRALARLVLVATGLLLLEAGFRIAGLGSVAEREGWLARAEGWREPGSEADGEGPELAFPSLDPFLGFTTRRLSQRLPGQAARFRPEVFDVVVLGGSVAAGMASLAAEDLAFEISQATAIAGREVRIVSLARGAFKQPQQLHLLGQALAHGWRPDAVINLDGFNELALGAQNALDFGAHPFWPSFPSLAPLASNAADPALRAAYLELDRSRERVRTLGGRLPLGLHHSAIVRALASAGLRKAVGGFEAARDAYLELVRSNTAGLASPPFDSTYEAVLELCVQNWFESSRSLYGVLSERAIPYLHVLQPTLHDADSKPLTPGEVEAGQRGPEVWFRAVREGYPRLRAAGARLTELGVPFHDASLVFRGDTRELYYDACHFGGPGQFTLAIDIGRAMADRLR